MWTDLTTWLQQHDTTIDLVTTWGITLASLAISIALLDAWRTLRHTRDETPVGTTLKHQKAALAVTFAINGLYWGLVLAIYYTHYQLSFWDRLGIRVVFITAMLVGAIFVARFIRSLRRELRKPPRAGSAPLALTPANMDDGKKGGAPNG